MSKTQNSFQILKHLTISRMFNILLLRISYLIARISKKPIHWGKPFSASIEPTTACNLGCPECPSGLKAFSRPTGKLDLDFHLKFLNELGSTVFYINYYFQGEPFLNPNFLQLIKQAKRKKIYTSTSTNAHFINDNVAQEIIDSKLDQLIISIDGLTQDTYENYRVNGKLDKVIQASKIITQKKKENNSHSPHLVFQFLAVRQNEHEIEEVFQLADEIGIDEVRIKTAQVYDYKNGNRLIPENEKYSRYTRKSDGTYKLKYKTYNKCWRMWSSTVFTWDGKVVPCCFDKDAKHIIGEIEKTNFNSIWKGKEMKAFRKNVITSRNQIEICQNCSEGTKVWA